MRGNIMQEFYKELSKHYLGISSAILIAILIGIIIKEPRVNLISILLGAAVYLMFLAISILIFKYSKTIRDKGEKENV